MPARSLPYDCSVVGLVREDIERALGPCDEAARIGSPSGSGECWRVVRNGAVLACKIVVKESEPQRFEREVAAMERLQSPRIARVLGYGELVIADDGQTHPYLLSEFVPGGDVRHNLAIGLPDDFQLRTFLGLVLEGIGELHAASVVHRDLKPENIVLRDGDWTSPVIIDLGLSRLVDRSSVTVYPWAGGTWPYMAPEQLRGERAIERTDLWAIAVVASELAAGAHPFLKDTYSGVPPDWDNRLKAGMAVPVNRPAAFREWIQEVGHYAAYRRPTATQARHRLDELWP